jgi:hypothetical protein
MKKYLLTLNGHGMESVFMRLNEDSFSFWFQKEKQEDFDIASYLCSPEDFEDIPDEYLDHESVFCHLYSPDLDSCTILVEEVQEDGSHKEILSEKFSDFIDKHEDIIHYNCDSTIKYEDLPEQVMECHSYEKGTIFGDFFEADDFDPKLLKIFVKEAPNGVDYFEKASYNGEELSNTECSTRGKGMEASVWER